MELKITPTNYDVKVQYKIKGKFYNSIHPGENASADPFEEIIVAKGQTWALPDNATLIKVVEMLPIPDQTAQIAQYQKAGGGDAGE